jgi:hypothetical protein
MPETNTRPEPVLGEMTSGRELVRAMERLYPDRDWLAALAKAAVVPRAEVERMLAGETLPDTLTNAVKALPETLDPGDPDATDDIFDADTNADAAVMEVDGEAGMVVSPSNKGMPSQTGSEHEMRTKSPKIEKNGEFLPLVGVPEALYPLHKETR